MSCYRLTFVNHRVFEVEVESASVQGELRTEVCTAVMYRVTNGAREHQPLSRSDGGPIQIIATSESMALDIARHVLADVTGSSLERLGECGHAMLPPLPDLA
jgi:hypothetical protein